MARLVIGTSKAKTVPAIVKEVVSVPNYIAPKNNVSGTYQPDNTATTFSFNGATVVGEGALYRAFHGCTTLTSVQGLENIKTIEPSGLYYAFYGCTGLTGKIDLSSLTSVGNGLQNCFQGCTGITSVDLSALTSFGSNYSMSYCFEGCTNLTSVVFSSLSSMNNSNVLTNCFSGCSSLTSIDFPALTEMTGSNAMSYCFAFCNSLTTVRLGNTTTINFGTRTNQFNSMFNGCTQNIDVYAPAGNQTAIEAMSGYPNFGGTGTVTWHWNTAE